MKKSGSDKKARFVAPLTQAEVKKSGERRPREIKQTRSLNTIAVYLDRARYLITQMSLETGTQEPDITDVVEWLVARSAQNSPSTIRQYRSAMAYHIESQFHAGVISDKEVAALTSALASMKSLTSVRTRKTSSCKAKSASVDVIQKLLRSLNETGGEYAKLAALIFMGSLIAGLRPVEWKSAKLKQSEDGSGILVVMNAKSTNGRSFGVNRELLVPAKHVELIRRLLADIEAALKRSGWKTIYEGCRKAVQRANIKSRGKNVSLYTARHQFSANMKNIYKPEDVALLMGHVSEETAGSHYGKRRSGHAEFKQHAGLIYQKDAPQSDRAS